MDAPSHLIQKWTMDSGQFSQSVTTQTIGQSITHLDYQDLLTVFECWSLSSMLVCICSKLYCIYKSAPVLTIKKWRQLAILLFPSLCGASLIWWGAVGWKRLLLWYIALIVFHRYYFHSYTHHLAIVVHCFLWHGHYHLCSGTFLQWISVAQLHLSLWFMNTPPKVELSSISIFLCSE